jgi:hypothetical protein
MQSLSLQPPYYVPLCVAVEGTPGVDYGDVFHHTDLPNPTVRTVISERTGQRLVCLRDVKLLAEVLSNSERIEAVTTEPTL